MVNLVKVVNHLIIKPWLIIDLILLSFTFSVYSFDVI